MKDYPASLEHQVHEVCQVSEATEEWLNHRSPQLDAWIHLILKQLLVCFSIRNAWFTWNERPSRLGRCWRSQRWIDDIQLWIRSNTRDWCCFDIMKQNVNDFIEWKTSEKNPIEYRIETGTFERLSIELVCLRLRESVVLWSALDKIYVRLFSIIPLIQFHSKI